MGIIDDIENEADPPEVWSGSDDKLEELIGILPKGSMKSSLKRRRREPEVEPAPNRMIIDLKMVKNPEDVCFPTDYKNSVEYAKALASYSKRIQEGYYAGYIIEINMGGILHRRRICEPVPDEKSAWKSPEFTVAVTKAVTAIIEFRE